MTISFPFLNVVKKRVRSVSGAEVQVVCPVTMALADSGLYWGLIYEWRTCFEETSGMADVLAKTITRQPKRFTIVLKVKILVAPPRGCWDRARSHGKHRPSISTTQSRRRERRQIEKSMDAFFSETLFQVTQRIGQKVRPPKPKKIPTCPHLAYVS